MPKFFWKGVDMFAGTHSGYLYATTEKELDAKLFSQDIALISSKQVRSWKKVAFSDTQRADFYAYFARLLDAGLLVPDALTSIAQSADNAKMYDMIMDIVAHVRQGDSLSKAMGLYSVIAPKTIVHVLAAGEQSGKLASSFRSIALYFKQVASIKKKVRSALFMPGITLVGFLCVIIFVVGMVVPRFADLLQSFDQKLPAITVWMLSLSGCFTPKLGIYSGVLFGTTFLGYRYAKTKTACIKVLDSIAINIPIFGSLFQLSIYAHLFQSLSLLLANGVLLTQALQLLAKSAGNTVVYDQLTALENAVRSGKSLSSSVKQHLQFCSDYATIPLLLVGETSGSLSDSCAHIAQEFFALLHERLSRLTGLIQPVCIALLGLGIAVLMTALYAPMMNISFGI